MRDAAAMLRRLSGRSHIVITGVAAQLARTRSLSDVEEVGVTFRALSDDDIARYIATGSRWTRPARTAFRAMARRSSSASTATTSPSWALPLNRLARLLESLGLRYDFGPLRTVSATATA